MIIINWFELLRTLTIYFAGLMLVKYFLFLLIAPFYPLKEKWRRIRIARKKKKGELPANYQPLVSVVIPAWNEEVGIVKSVKSLLENDYPNLEIIVVNDGSTDRTEEKLLEYLHQLPHEKAKKVRYFYKENGGKGTALNLGIKKSKGEIIVTMDADSAFAPQTISNLVKYFEDPSIDAVVGNVKITSNRTLVGFLQQLEYLFGFYYKRAHAVLGAEYIFGGACAAFRKKNTFARYGLFDTENKTEDIEMTMRLRYYGIKCTYAEDAICYTEGAASLTGLINQRLRWKKGRFDTFIKYRQMFFSTKKEHNKFLTFMVLPLSLLSELQLFFEPIGATLLVVYSFVSNDYLSLTLSNLFVFIIYFVNSIFGDKKLRLKLLIMFFYSWALFYLLVWVEYLALIKSLKMIVRGEDVKWQNWQRLGVSDSSI